MSGCSLFTSQRKRRGLLSRWGGQLATPGEALQAVWTATSAL